MGKYYIDVQGTRADGTHDYVTGSIRANSQSDAVKRAENEAESRGIVKITSKTVEPL